MESPDGTPTPEAVTAMVDYNLAQAQGSSRFEAADGGIFTVDLTANTGKDDEDANAKEGIEAKRKDSGRDTHTTHMSFSSRWAGRPGAT